MAEFMLPKPLALVDDDQDYAPILGRHFTELGVAATVFADSAALLTHVAAYDFDFYVVDLTLPDIDGLELIKVIRRRSQAGIVVVSGRLAPDVFDDVITAGADMYLAKPVRLNQVDLAVRAVQRRVVSAGVKAAGWTLDRRARQLVAPDGCRVDLSESDQQLMASFLAAQGQVVARDTLRACLGRAADGEGGDGLNATIFRLRRRIEPATPAPVPLQAISRVGYVFRAPLQAT